MTLLSKKLYCVRQPKIVMKCDVSGRYEATYALKNVLIRDLFFVIICLPVVTNWRNNRNAKKEKKKCLTAIHFISVDAVGAVVYLYMQSLSSHKTLYSVSLRFIFGLGIAAAVDIRTCGDLLFVD